MRIRQSHVALAGCVVAALPLAAAVQEWLGVRGAERAQDAAERTACAAAAMAAGVEEENRRAETDPRYANEHQEDEPVNADDGPRPGYDDGSTPGELPELDFEPPAGADALNPLPDEGMSPLKVDEAALAASDRPAGHDDGSLVCDVCLGSLLAPPLLEECPRVHDG